MIQFRDLLKRLLDEEVEFVVVGGLAATLHGVSEPTRDIDVCIRPSDDTWTKVARVLSGIHPRYALTPDRRAFEPSLAALKTFKNLYALTDLGRIDFLGEVAPLGDLSRVLANATTFEIDGRAVRVISLDDLLTVKEHIRRPKDLEVAVELRAIRDRRAASRKQAIEVGSDVDE